MILDRLANHSRYVAWLPQLAAGFEFLTAQGRAALEEGRYEIDGERVFATVARYETRAYESAEPEAHRRYLDIQYVVSGRETIYWTPLAETGPESIAYDAARDLVFFQRNARARPFELAAGHFCVFFPEDAHQPNCHCGPPAPVHKVVVKVAV